MPGSNPPYNDQTEHVPPPSRWLWLALIAVLLILIACFILYLALTSHRNLSMTSPTDSWAVGPQNTFIHYEDGAWC
jgi:drug/metabolite transporter (DMT)-like permease